LPVQTQLYGTMSYSSAKLQLPTLHSGPAEVRIPPVHGTS